MVRSLNLLTVVNRLMMEVGQLAEEIGDDEAALEAYETASKRKDRTAETFERRSRVALRLGNIKRASEGYKFLVDHYGVDDLELVHTLAACYEELSSREVKRLSLLEHFSENVMYSAKAKEPRKAKLREDKTSLSDDEGGIEEESDEKELDDETAAKEEEKQFAAALSLFNKCIDLLMRRKQYLKAMGCIKRFAMFLETGKHGGTKVWRYTAHLRPKLLPLDVAVKHGVCCLLLGKESGLTELVEQLVESRVTIDQKLRGDLLALIAQAYFEVEDWHRALSIFKTVARPSLIIYIALCHDSLENTDEAIDSYHKTLAGERSEDGHLIISNQLRSTLSVDSKVVATRLFALCTEEDRIEKAVEVQRMYKLSTEELADGCKDARGLWKKLIGRPLSDQGPGERWMANPVARIYCEPLYKQCKEAMEDEDFVTTVSIGIRLLYPYLLDEAETSRSYKDIAVAYPSTVNRMGRGLDADEVLWLATNVTDALVNAGSEDLALSLIDELCARSASSNSFCPTISSRGVVLCKNLEVALICGNFDELGRKITKFMSLAAQPVDGFPELLRLFRYAAPKVSSEYKPNFNRQVYRLLDKEMAEKGSLALHLFKGQHDFWVGNPVKALSEFSKAMKLAPGNPYACLFTTACYLRAAMNRRNMERNMSILKAITLLSRYTALMRETYENTSKPELLELELNYNQGVALESCGLEVMAHSFYLKAINVQGVPKSTKREVAFALSRLAQRSGNIELAQTIAKEYLVM